MAARPTKKAKKRPSRSTIKRIAKFWQNVRKGSYSDTTAMQNAISAMKLPNDLKKGLRADLVKHLAEKSGQQELPTLERKLEGLRPETAREVARLSKKYDELTRQFNDCLEVAPEGVRRLGQQPDVQFYLREKAGQYPETMWGLVLIDVIKLLSDAVGWER